MFPLLCALALVASPQGPVSVGERLVYRVKYGPLTAGTMTLGVAGIEEVREESCYHLTMHLESNPAYAGLFRVDDRLESFARCADFVTLRNEKRINETRYQNRIAADFDYATNTVSYSDGTELGLAGLSRDLLSLWYYLRASNLALGDEFYTTVHVDKRNLQADVSVRAGERVRTRAGQFDCLVIETRSSGPAGAGKVWLSDDERRIPVVIRTRMPFGYITATLTAIEEE